MGCSGFTVDKICSFHSFTEFLSDTMDTENQMINLSVCQITMAERNSYRLGSSVSLES